MTNKSTADAHYSTPTWAYVIDDMVERNQMGKDKYNKYLTVSTEEDMLQHAYEEALDLAVYLKTQILKRDAVHKLQEELPLHIGDYL